MASPNRQGATGGTTWRTTRLRWVWRPPYYHGVRKSSIWRPIRRNRARRAPYGDGHGRKMPAREKGRGKHRARGKASRAREIRRAGREERRRNQRAERGAPAGKNLLARPNAFARAAGRSCCRRGSASPSPVPHPREEQPSAGCCFPVASSGPPLSRTRAASPLPSLFPTRARSSRRRTAVSPPSILLLDGRKASPRLTPYSL